MLAFTRRDRQSSALVLALAFLCMGCPQRVFAQLSAISGQILADKPERPMIFDVNSLRADEIIGFEWHNPSSTPLKYNGTGAGGDGSSCGTAIFRTK